MNIRKAMIEDHVRISTTLGSAVATLPLLSVTVSVTVFVPRLAQVNVFGLTLSDAMPQASELFSSTSAPVIVIVPVSPKSIETSRATASGATLSSERRKALRISARARRNCDQVNVPTVTTGKSSVAEF